MESNFASCKIFICTREGNEALQLGTVHVRIWQSEDPDLDNVLMCR